MAALTNPCNLKGNVKVVSNSNDATYKVRIVTPSTDAQPDLRVQKVAWIASSPGQWRFGNFANPDFTIVYVSQGEDFTVQFVPYLPGCRGA